jgi:hypothetical protein
MHTSDMSVGANTGMKEVRTRTGLLLGFAGGTVVVTVRVGEPDIIAVWWSNNTFEPTFTTESSQRPMVYYLPLRLDSLE